MALIRNRIEHVNEDIFNGENINGLFLRLDESFTKIIYNNKELLFVDLAKTIEDAHALVLKFINNFPWKREGNTYEFR